MIVDKKVIDAITEYINIGAGRAADSMNQLLNSHISLSIPWIRVTNYEFNNPLPDDTELVGIKMVFSGCPQGNALMVFRKEDIAVLTNGLLGCSNIDYADDSIRQSALSEVGNIVINAIIGSISNLIGSQVSYQVPNLIELKIRDLYSLVNSESFFISAGTIFGMSKFNIGSQIVMFFDDHKFYNKLCLTVEHELSGPV